MGSTDASRSVPDLGTAKSAPGLCMEAVACNRLRSVWIILASKQGDHLFVSAGAQSDAPGASGERRAAIIVRRALQEHVFSPPTDHQLERLRQRYC